VRLDASDIAELKPVIRQVVQNTIDELRAESSLLGSSDRIALTEEEAAAAIGVQRFRLRDARLRGEVHGRKVGRIVVYERGELIRYLTEREAK
jgi:hypothetical protein